MFVSLHTHSCYSLLDSTAKPEEIVDRIKELGQTAVAITDHGNVFASVYVHKLCKKAGIKAIYGTEIYITDDRTVKTKESNTYHLVLLAANEQGRININKLLSLAHIEYFYRKPRIDFELLCQHSEGIIVLSACMAGEVARHLQHGDTNSAISVAQKYHKHFGSAYYLEIQSHRSDEQYTINQQVIAIAKQLNIPWVVTTDAHYLRPDDQHLHSVFIQVSQDRDAGEAYVDCCLQSESDVRNILSSHLTDADIEVAIQNTCIIADMCNATIPLSPPQIPAASVPAPHKSELDYLKHLCSEGWKQKQFHTLPHEEKQKYIARLRYEVDTIEKAGFAGYYLLVHSYVHVSTRRGIARGSGGGSLVAYLLNITDIDPVKYGLYFERFLDVGQIEQLERGIIQPEEIKTPDIDMDFGAVDREKVLRFIVNKYGKDRVACLGTFNVMWEKTAIKDVGKVLGIPFEETNEITQTLGDTPLVEALHSGLLNKWAQHKKLFDYAARLSGLPKSYGKHPCGRVIATRDLEYYGALTENDGELVFQMEQKSAESLGLIKVDLLSLRTVDVIYDTLAFIGKDYQYINPAKLNFADPVVLDTFSSGNTCGAFQFESNGMVSTLKQVRPSGLGELAVCNALFRPGSIKHIDTFIRRKFEHEEYTYLHPDLEDVLRSTYGVIVFQEQLIQIGRIAGLRNPDALRKGTGKKDAKILAEVGTELREKLLARGWTQEQFDALWLNMLEFARYSFNAAHAYAYSMIAYITMFLKAYHPTEFLAALMNSYIDKMEEIPKCVQEAKRLGIPITMPQWNDADALCIPHNGITYGLGLIKYCNPTLAQELKILKPHYPTFTGLLIDAVEKTSITHRTMTILVSLNCFRQFGKNAKLLSVCEALKDGKTTKYTKAHSDKTKQQRVAALYALEAELPDKALPMCKQIALEKEYLGFAVSTYPQTPNNYAIVTSIEKVFTPKVTVYYLQSGEQRVFKIPSKAFYKNGDEACGVGDVLIVGCVTQKPRKRRLANGVFEDIEGEFEEWVDFPHVLKAPKEGGVSNG